MPQGGEGIALHRWMLNVLVTRLKLVAGKEYYKLSSIHTLLIRTNVSHKKRLMRSIFKWMTIVQHIWYRIIILYWKIRKERDRIVEEEKNIEVYRISRSRLGGKKNKCERQQRNHI